MTDAPAASHPLAARPCALSVLVALAASALACEGPTVPDTSSGSVCASDDECDPGDSCVHGHCTGTSAGVDAGQPDAGADAGPAPQGHLTLSPAHSDVSATVGLPTPPVALTLGNDGEGTLHYTLSCTGGAIAQAGGTLAPGVSASVSIELPAFTSAGTQSLGCTATAADASNGPLSWTATVTVAAAPIGHLTVTPAHADLNAAAGKVPSPASFAVANDGTAVLQFTVSCTGGATPSTTGQSLAAGASTDVAVTLPTFAAAGTQSLSCAVVAADAANGPLAWTATITVAAAPVGHLTLSPLQSSLTAVAGTQPAPVTLTVGDDGTAALHWALACTGGATPSASSGTLAAAGSAAVVVTLPAFSQAGTTQTVGCTATTSDGQGGPLSWAGSVKVSSPQIGHLTLSPAPSDLTATAGAASAPVTVTVGNDGTAQAHWAVTCSAGGATPASGLLAAGANTPVRIDLPVWPAAGAQTLSCSFTSTDASNGAALAWTATVTVSPATTGTGVGPNGGAVDLLNFVFTGDTRPGSCDATSSYPAANFAAELRSMPQYAPQFGLDLGDHMFVCSGGVSTARAQMKIYTDALAANWPAGKMWFMTMGNHECNTGGAAQVCGTTDVNYVAYAEALAAVSQKTNPNYKIDVQTRLGLVRILFAADNQATTADVAQLDAWMTEADTSAAATFLARHHTVAPGSRTGPTWLYPLLDKHKLTALLIAHDHKYYRSNYPRTTGGTTIPAVVCGLGAANASYVGFCRMQQKADGSFDMIQYDVGGNPKDTWNLVGKQ